MSIKLTVLWLYHLIVSECPYKAYSYTVAVMK